jgi:rubrerythrin
MRAVMILGVLALPVSAVSPALSQETVETFPETKAVLLDIHRGELRALTSYRAYAGKALEEDYPKIAALFTALSASESVHARNMREVLAELGVALFEKEPDVEVSNTKENLSRAMEVELSEINETYPAHIERITPENYPSAVDAITYAWKAEVQHRDLIEKIRGAVGLFFGTVASKIEAAPATYFICDVCGSTTQEPAEDNCGICGGHASHSHEVPGMSAGP